VRGGDPPYPIDSSMHLPAAPLDSFDVQLASILHAAG